MINYKFKYHSSRKEKLIIGVSYLENNIIVNGLLEYDIKLSTKKVIWFNCREYNNGFYGNDNIIESLGVAEDDKILNYGLLYAIENKYIEKICKRCNIDIKTKCI